MHSAYADEAPWRSQGEPVEAGTFGRPAREFCAFENYEYKSPHYAHPSARRSFDVDNLQDCATECSLDALCTAAQFDQKNECKMYSFTEGYAKGIALPSEASDVGKLIVTRPCNAVEFAGTDQPGPSTEMWLDGALLATCYRCHACQMHVGV